MSQAERGEQGGAKLWKERSEVTVESNPKCPTLQLRVDNGHECGKKTIVAELWAFLFVKNEMKYVHKIWKGSHEH